jgi:hypothetical protein
MYMAPREPTLQAAANTDSNWRTEDSTNHLDDASNEGMTQTRRRRPIRRPDLGFPPVFEVGKHGQSHDDASKEVTAPAGVAVVSFTQGFLLALPSTPTIGYAQQGAAFWPQRW